MKNKKGFTLIELLAVIVILGLLMAIAIPSVTKYITQSRKKTLVNSMDSYITAATTAVNNNEFGALSDQDVIYYIPVNNDSTKSCVSLEKGGTDPFGNWKEAYVAVNYNAEKYSYDYFFTFYDDAGYGMRLTKSDAIKPSGDGQIINPTPVDESSITTQLGGRAKSSKVLSVGTCNSSNTSNGGAVAGGSGDNVAPTVLNHNTSEDDTQITYNITLSNLNSDDYPIKIEYYIKLVSDVNYVKKHTVSITSGDSSNYTYTGLSTHNSYNIKAVITDKSGNSTESLITAGTQCFLAGTKVLTATGFKNIEDIKLGEKVYSLDLDNNSRELKEVTNLIHNKTYDVYELLIGDNVVKTTPRHEFYIVDKGWVRAYELEEGDVVASTSNENMEIKSINHKFYDEPIDTYNLTVIDNHNYLITEYRLVVHNSSPVEDTIPEF